MIVNSIAGLFGLADSARDGRGHSDGSACYGDSEQAFELENATVK